VAGSKVKRVKIVPPVHRLKWFREARFGMFIHWGLYSQLGRWEWTMHNEQIPRGEYEKIAEVWKPRKRPMRQWARLAAKVGMKYIVMTTKHHDGFCLWDTRQTDFNSAGRGTGRDLVREYVEACREYGLKVGLYYSLMDWHHPDGMRCATDEKARKRFLDYTFGAVRELCSNYGKIDVLWYDNAYPKMPGTGWRARQLNAMVRRLQPHILINNRSGPREDFGTPEGRVVPGKGSQAWEACVSMSPAWSHVRGNRKWATAPDVVEMLAKAAGGGGNLLLNVGPRANGTLPPEPVESLKALGKWIAKNGEALYGKVDVTRGKLNLMNTGTWTLKDKTAYFWVLRYSDTGQIVIGRFRGGKLRKASWLATGKAIDFEQIGSRVFLNNLPRENPDSTVGIPVIKMEFASPPRQVTDWSYTDPDDM